jgi:hypothetical protein
MGFSSGAARLREIPIVELFSSGSMAKKQEPIANSYLLIASSERLQARHSHNTRGVCVMGQHADSGSFNDEPCFEDGWPGLPTGVVVCRPLPLACQSVRGYSGLALP